MPSLENGKWQPIPGLPGAEMFPFIRKPDIVSCNSYLIRTPSELVVIDPGADAEQMARILDMVREEAGNGRSITFYLTHCHVDHCFQIASAYRDGTIGPIDLVVQQAGAEALRELDADLTQARIMGWTFPPSFLEVRYSSLLSKSSLTGELSLGTRMDVLPTEEGMTVNRQVVPLDGGEMEVFHTPGHSPDSVCYLVGKYLLSGDLLFAAEPGVAGQVGWDRDALVTSVRNALWLLRARDIELCCPGHGRPVDKKTAQAILESMLKRAGELGSIHTYDLDRVRFTSDYALDILMEANEAFTVLAGRLYYLSYYLEELEESEEARRCMEAIQADKIDELLASFHSFVEEFKEGRKVQLQVVLKAVQTIQSIERLFTGTHLEELMEASLLRKTSRLLVDFTNAIKGVEFQTDPVRSSLDDLVERTVEALASPPPPEDEILNAVGDDRAYLAALAKRIAHLPIYDDVSFAVGRGDANVLADEGRFIDALCSLLEEYVGVEARTISLEVRDGDKPVLLVSSERDVSMLSTEKRRAHRRRFELAGAKMWEEDEPASFVIEFERAGS
ncbi:MBL fold metallo-hydrolase [Methanomassiliicoccus luminyensis]|jgi:glyoxylase-like metal-dependent hydrolase (beta-lactamase superfamily II)|uniref:MBL fold metallo-hydrolase n=1 Tax=Methanomassiliicoccus luminyensis TaxID=1080712 RepID=UPI00037D311D|nr:MBL fold metallo-hydrolase [Methanomassiliicoccus luminyensis]